MAIYFLIRGDNVISKCCANDLTHAKGHFASIRIVGDVIALAIKENGNVL